MASTTASRRLRIGYLTVRDPYDRRSWSGTIYSMALALEKHCGEVLRLGPLLPHFLKVQNVIRRGIESVTGKRYLHTQTNALSRGLGAIADQKISEARCDVVVAPVASACIAHLRTSLPVIYLSDATVRLMTGYYEDFRNLLPSSLRVAERLEQQSIQKSIWCVYPSSWAADSAASDYGADRSKVSIIPFGANLTPPLSRDEAVTHPVPRGRCRLLFVGVDWDRKGGDIALETLLELQRMGIDADLTVVGCEPRVPVRNPGLKFIPFLNKNDRDGRASLDSLYGSADFFLLPSRAECFSIALCEANAYGIPVLSTRTGGLPELVREGINGFLFPLEARGREYALRIRETFDTPGAYGSLRATSREQFETRLNWDAWGRSMCHVISDVISLHSLQRTS